VGKQQDYKSRRFVREYLSHACDVTLTDLPQTYGTKCADFEMTDTGERVLVAELKTLRDVPPSVEAGWNVTVDEDGIQEAWREHNGPARIARVVHDAHGQLSAYPHPWAMIILNEDPGMSVGDLYEAFTGARYLGRLDGHRVFNVASRKIALGNTLNERYGIDLYIWINREGKPPIAAWWSTPRGEEIGRRYFSAVEKLSAS
jgi:hypothetical protein